MKKGFKGRKIFDILGRKKIIVCLIILIILLSIATISLIIKAVQENSHQEVKTYTENSYIGYRVYLKKNDYFKQDYLEEDRQYIASLIKNVNANFKYKLLSAKGNEDYKYTYRIEADVNVENTENQNSIYKFSEDLVKERRVEVTNSNALEIDEIIKIDYNKYNKIIKEFISVYKLSEITPTVTINMYVEVEGITKTKNTPVASLVIPLREQTVAIDIESNSVNATELNVYKDIANKEHLYVAVLTFMLTIMVIIELYIFLNDTKDEKAIYKMKIKKILLNYDSYIQKVNNEFDYSGHQQLEVKTFEDLLQIRDTIGEPILMIEKEVDKETDFLIPSKGKVIYVYKLRREDVKKKENKN